MKMKTNKTLMNFILVSGKVFVGLYFQLHSRMKHSVFFRYFMFRYGIIYNIVLCECQHILYSICEWNNTSRLKTTYKTHS